MSDALQTLPGDIREMIDASNAPPDFKRRVAEEASCLLTAASEDLEAGRIPWLVREGLQDLIDERLLALESQGRMERYIDSSGEVRWRLRRMRHGNKRR